MAAASSANRRIRPSGKRRAAESAAALWGKSAPLSPAHSEKREETLGRKGVVLSCAARADGDDERR